MIFQSLVLAQAQEQNGEIKPIAVSNQSFVKPHSSIHGKQLFSIQAIYNTTGESCFKSKH